MRKGNGEIARRFSETNREIRVVREVTTNQFLRRRLSIFPEERVKVSSPRLRLLVTRNRHLFPVPGHLPIVVVVVVIIVRAQTRPGRFHKRQLAVDHRLEKPLPAFVGDVRLVKFPLRS